MTTIAWDGMTLAGDRQATYGDTPYQTTKVFKVKLNGKKYLVGFAGDLADGQAFVEYVKRGFKDRPQFKSFTGLVIHEDGTLAWYDENPNHCLLKPDFVAIGSGGSYVMGAMAFGATAAEAVFVAMKLDINTGLGIAKVSF